MSAITELTLCQLKEKIDCGQLEAYEIFSAFKKAYEQDKNNTQPINGYIEFYNENEKMARTKNITGDGLLQGLPIAIKDNILIKGKEATCASAVLQGFKAPYSATVVKRLLAQGAIPLGRTNMDEFAMGSSCEYSAYGATRNPHNRQYSPGGSSGGSAAVVAACQAPAALGSDTGGSVRLPASFCGIYGLKPTYGTLSRYGLIAFGSSLDQIGILARSPEDIALILQVTAGKCNYDQTSLDTDFNNLYPLAGIDLKELKVALPQELFGEGINSQVHKITMDFVQWLKGGGASVETISIPFLKQAVAMYYIIAPAEAASNLARYDGVQYGLRKQDIRELEQMYFDTRSAGLGGEVKRRIFLGNYVLSSGYYDAYYKKAMLVRSLLIQECRRVLKEYNLILSATCPTPPFKIGQKVDDPLAMYLSDVCTTYVNLARLPSISVPAGYTDQGLPVGVQLTADMLKEDLLLKTAQLWYREGGGQ